MTCFIVVFFANFFVEPNVWYNFFGGVEKMGMKQPRPLVSSYQVEVLGMWLSPQLKLPIPNVTWCFAWNSEKRSALHLKKHM